MTPPHPATLTPRIKRDGRSISTNICWVTDATEALGWCVVINCSDGHNHERHLVIISPFNLEIIRGGEASRPGPPVGR